MCQTCGCGATQGTETETVTVLENLMARNDRIAEHVRHHFDAHGVLAINLMSSPGSGKTSLLEAIIQGLAPEIKVAVIEGDLETENDAARIRRHGVPAVQITTGVTCHLDAAMVHDALDSLPIGDIDVLFIENVGNLVCPADFDLGQHANVVLLSVTEGDDKPDKYPVIFRAADMVLITKTDLLPHIEEFDLAKVEQSLRRVGGDVPILALSAKTHANLEAWCNWLRSRLATHRLSCPKNGHAHDHSHGTPRIA
ncbi:MAG: hydrogenase nickel incorporation protein HypB [Rhodospirillum sp.]|nr:hydrogenase nickel incorporation protein HypB [Rhodospirillum sp.]MCF8489235.1 hydrogenase nickel incorporation protein HypB [Rhodospirillum sp.]MCF8500528.1 hydrogenase nickel incorporation protein HypB [Rhodospirillum sp.]